MQPGPSDEMLGLHGMRCGCPPPIDWDIWAALTCLGALDSAASARPACASSIAAANASASSPACQYVLISHQARVRHQHMSVCL